ncbi:alpha/beta hydrolase-fold protein [Bacillus sp. 1780r2a1]|nr:alpha/beta hydrolase-fold protein [Bacillus sp. 1780r2a1]
MSKHSIVEILNFKSSYLQNERNLYVYLPPSYEQAQDTKYPVLYMHDGQNIFHPAFNGQSWNIHHVVNKLIEQGEMQEIIIVGIENMKEERANEYSFHTLDEDSLQVPPALACIQPKGELYERFIVNEVKPFIDEQFRTKKEAKYTALMGSSRGGAITYHIGLKRPDVFSMLAILSPYFYYVDPHTLQEFSQVNIPVQKVNHKKIWVDVGEYEGVLIRVEHVKDIANKLLTCGYQYGEEVAYYQDDTAAHTEADWEARVHMPLLYFFGKETKLAAVELKGRSIFGLNEKAASLNAVKTYSNGVKVTELQGEYQVADKRVVSIAKDGTVIPKSVGKTVVQFQSEGIKTSKEIEIVDYVSDRVPVSMQVKSIDALPDVLRIYADLPLKRVDSYHFYNQFILPIDTGLGFRFYLDNGKGEVKESGAPVYHRIMITHPIHKKFTVEKWL